MMIAPYPLAWPDTLPRAAVPTRSAFKATLPQAIANVQTSLRLFGADVGVELTDVVVTSNVGLMIRSVDDPGVAVWFTWEGEPRCFAVDRYLSVAENLQAIHHILEARRTEFRHAGIEVTRQAFRGFALALPSPDRAARPALWWEVLEVPFHASLAEVKAAYRSQSRLASAAGDEARLRDLNVARDAALKARGARP